MASLDNANPTILSASQLPTRQTKRVVPRRGPDSVYALPFLDKLALHAAWDGVDDGPSSAEASEDSEDDLVPDAIDEQEIYDLISTISDPEHPVSLGQLSVINLPDIRITPSPAQGSPSPSTIVTVAVDVTPTITHCSLATVIGLGIRVRLERALPPNYRVVVRCKEGSHSQDDQVNKQLADKERVAAALENDTLRGVLDKMLETCV